MNRRRNRRIRKRYRKLIRNLLFSLTILLMLIVVTKLAFYVGKETGNHKGNRSKNEIESIDAQVTKSGVETNKVFAAKYKEFSQNYASKKERCNQYVVCLDAGHGGNDVGAERDNGVYEKEETLKLALLIQEYLESTGVRVIMTREKDKYLSLDERRNIASSGGANLLLSLHRNAYVGTEDVQGIETWINNSQPQDAVDVSKSILKNIKDEIPSIKNRGVKWGTMDNVNENYAINKVSMTSLILELGFTTSQHDNEIFDNNLDEYARGIAKGILETI